jgi:hypothetical protein
MSLTQLRLAGTDEHESPNFKKQVPNNVQIQNPNPREPTFPWFWKLALDSCL